MPNGDLQIVSMQPTDSQAIPAPVRSLWTTGEYDPQAQQWKTTYEGPNKPDESGLPPSLSIVSQQPTPQAPPEERFVKSLNRVFYGAGDPQELLTNLKQEAKDLWNDPNALSPAAQASKILQGVHQGMQDTWARAEQEWKAGNFTTAAGLISRTDSAIDAVLSGVPALGPILSGAGQQISKGDIAGGAGTTIGAVGPFLLGKLAPQLSEAPQGYKPPPLVPSPQQAVEAVRQLAGRHPETTTAIGKGVGGVVGGGIGTKIGGPVGAIAGYQIGKEVGAGAAERFMKQPPEAAPEPPPSIDWSAFERTEPPSGPLGPRTPPPAPPGGTAPPPATPEQLAAIRQEFENIRARGQAAPAAEAPTAEAPAALTGDELAREYGYDDEADAIRKVGRGAWQIAKAQGYAAGRPVGAAPSVAEPPAAVQPAPAAAPASAAAPAPSTLTQQLRASLAQEPEVAPRQPPEEYAPWGGQFAPGRAPTAPEIAGMRQSVDNLVEQKIPFDQFPTLNRRTSAQVGHALEQGDVAKAQQLFNDAVESTDPKATAAMTEEQAQKASETDQWTRVRAAQGDNKYFGKKMAVQQARVNASPELATSFRDAVAQFMKANAPQLSKP